MTWHWDIIGSLGGLIIAGCGAVYKLLRDIRERDMVILNRKLDQMLKEGQMLRELSLRTWDKLEKHIAYHLDKKL